MEEGSVINLGDNSEEEAGVRGNGKFMYGLITLKEHSHSTVYGEKENHKLPLPARFSFFVEAVQN